jgi:aldose 1-epimerase
MSFSIQTREATAGDRRGPVYELVGDGASAEVWPMCGFNCLRWSGPHGPILYAMPDWETSPVPTRSGHPILFPFPGRLRDGSLPTNDKSFQLPLNDSTKKHAIHGFTPRNPWRVASTVEKADHASIIGVFDLPSDLPSAVGMWPSDFLLSVTYSLFADRLAVEANVLNRGGEPLPFGLGYHPYFRLPNVTDADVGGHVLQANVDKLWLVDADNLPTGELKPVPADLDFRSPRPIGSTALDHVLSGVTTSGTMRELAVLSHPASPGRLRIRADDSFRELVLFTPAHRQAVAIEPYTCSADASHLAARGIDSGWRTLAPGAEWTGRVEYVWETVTSPSRAGT